jgi:hypothetical protein
MLSGLSLKNARACIGAPLNRRNDRTDAKRIRTALKLNSIALGREVPCDDWQKLIKRKIRLALLAVNYDEDLDRWHWILFDVADEAKPLLDPRTGTRRKFTRKTRLCSYYAVREG